MIGTPNAIQNHQYSHGQQKREARLQCNFQLSGNVGRCDVLTNPDTHGLPEHRHRDNDQHRNDREAQQTQRPKLTVEIRWPKKISLNHAETLDVPNHYLHTRDERSSSAKQDPTPRVKRGTHKVGIDNVSGTGRQNQNKVLRNFTQSFAKNRCFAQESNGKEQEGEKSAKHVERDRLSDDDAAWKDPAKRAFEVSEHSAPYASQRPSAAIIKELAKTSLEFVWHLPASTARERTKTCNCCNLFSMNNSGQCGRNRLTRLLLVWCALIASGFFAPAHARADSANGFHWEPVDGAQVKLDDKVPLTWNVLQVDKKKQSNLVLVLLGRRYLLLDTKAKRVYLVFPTDLHTAGNDFDSDDLAMASRIIPSTAWSDRNIGPAEEYRVTLGDYGRTLSVQLPHPLDIRLGIY